MSMSCSMTNDGDAALGAQRADVLQQLQRPAPAPRRPSARRAGSCAARSSARGRAPAACAARPTACRHSRRPAGSSRSSASISCGLLRAPPRSRRATRRGASQRMRRSARRADRVRRQHHVLEHASCASARAGSGRCAPGRRARPRRRAVRRCAARRSGSRRACGRQKAGDQIEHGRLAGAVRTDQRGDRALRDRELTPSTAATPPKDVRRPSTSSSSRHHFSSSSSRRLPRMPCGRIAMNSTSSNTDQEQAQERARAGIEQRQREEIEEARAGIEQAEQHRAERDRPDPVRCRRGSGSGRRRR